MSSTDPYEYHKKKNCAYFSQAKHSKIRGKHHFGHFTLKFLLLNNASL